MDFTLTENQVLLSELAVQIFEDQCSVDRIKEVEDTPDRFDARLWSALEEMLTVCVPEEAGGLGLGVIELCLVLEQQGRRLGQVPLLWHSVATAALAHSGLPVPDGIVTLALAEPGLWNARPSVAFEDGRVSGTKISVPWAHIAGSMLVSTDAGLVLVESNAPGVTCERAEATNHEIVGRVHLEQAPGTLVGDARFAVDRALVGLCALQVGVAEQALAMAAEYTSTRVQFGKPLSTFQSTSARAADAYIDTEAMRATMWQAAWRLDTGLDAAVEIEVAKWWASEAGQRVVHATQHMHGGIGADVSYPIHRYFLWGKQLEDTLGGGSAHLATIGRALI